MLYGRLTVIFSVDIDRYTFAAGKSTGGAFAYQRVFCVHVVLAVVDRVFFFCSLLFLCTAQMKKVEVPSAATYSKLHALPIHAG